MKKTFVTKEGYDKLCKELEFLKKDGRREIAKEIKTAKEHGDLSENSEYTQAKEEQAKLELHIAELEAMLKNAVIIEEKDEKSNVVKIGSTIIVKSDGREQRFTIVGSSEASPAQGRISNESPLGEAFLGKNAGERVEVETPSGKREYQILEVE